MIGTGTLKLYKTEWINDGMSPDGGYSSRTGEFDEYHVQVLQFLSASEVMVAMRIGGTPFSSDVDDLVMDDAR